MSLYDYIESKELAAQDRSFYALVMAAMRRADSFNHARLNAAFPEVHRELLERYDRPFGGVLRSEPPALIEAACEQRCGVCGRHVEAAEIVGRLPHLRDLTICLDCCAVHFDLPAEDGPLSCPA